MNLGSQSLLNVYVLNSEPLLDLKVRFINYFHSSNVNLNAAPTFLRISGQFSFISVEITTLNVFLDDQLDISNAANFVSSLSGASCKSFQPLLVQIENPGLSQRVDIYASFRRETHLEIFLPVRVNVKSGASLKFGTFFIDIGFSKLEASSFLSVKEIF